MSDWFSIADLLALKSDLLPASERSLYRFLDERAELGGADVCRPRAAQGGGREYHLSLLPYAVQAQIRAAEKLDATRQAVESAEVAKRNAVWAIYEGASASAKEEAQRRLAVVRLVDDLIASGPKALAVAAVTPDVHPAETRVPF